jgi:peptide/histidine transporter 3/4
MPKAAILILSWAVFVGILQFMLSNTVLVLLLYGDVLPFITLPSAIVIYYASFALVYIFYPVSGYFADVYCGRFRIIAGSLALLLFILIFCVIFYTLRLVLNNLTNSWNIILGSAGLVCTLIAVIGVAGYGANFIQFGLDQLLEAPSHHQALFVHWAKWCYDLISVLFLFVFAYIQICLDANSLMIQLTISISSVVLFFELVLALLLIIGCWKHHWFYSEPAGRRNPYKMVFKVLNFARKYSYALQRSAFTYCDDERPSRLDFAKERFGGPFTTEQVEDVKTFFRIVMVLLAIGPIFILDAPTSAALLTFMGVHLGPVDQALCEWSWMIVNTGLLRYIVSTLFLPIYSWIIFIVLYKRVPKIFWRLGFGILLYFLGGLSLFLVDAIGHIQYQRNDTQCIVLFSESDDSLFDVSSLGMHWAVFIPSNVLIGIGPPLVTVTIFEFISAQSPHAMKGLLLGTYYAITGVYQFISSVALVPFFSYKFQSSGYLPRTGCLFGYSLYICVIAFIGLILFMVAAKCYRYREREDRPYDQRFVIDIYNRYLNGVHDHGLCSDSDSP